MDLKIVVVVALALGMGFAASNTDYSSFDNTSLTGDSIKEFDVNSESYFGQEVTVTGERTFSLSGKWSKGYLTGSSGHDVRVDCEQYEDMQVGQSYTVTGKLVNESISVPDEDSETVALEKKYVPVLKCTESPQ